MADVHNAGTAASPGLAKCMVVGHPENSVRLMVQAFDPVVLESPA